MTTLTHQALVLDRAGGALSVQPVAIAEPGEGQIAIRVRAVAVNPVDRYMPSLARLITPWLAYPAVLGSDVAGEVEVVGPGVTRLRVGQRVIGFALGTEKGRGPAQGAFQERVIVDEALSSPIPDALQFEQAAVLPLGLSTAASGLFQADFLALEPPAAAGAAPTGRSVLVWGASTSVGSNAVQLAAHAGYDVVATASPHNHAYVALLGARAVVDYRSPNVVADLAAALKGRELAGALAVGEGSLAACIRVLARCEGRRFIANATPALSFERLTTGGRIRWQRLASFLVRMGVASARDALAARQAGVSARFIWGSGLKDNAVGPMIYRDFLPSALAAGRYVAAPPPRVAGHGLGAVPVAFAELAKGVSASKIVVTL